MKFSDLIYVLATVIAAPFAYADDASDLNNLQRQIDAAKAAKKSKPAAAAPANPAPERVRQDADALRLANLTVQSDASCILSVNGEKKTTLSAGVSSVKVPSGKSLVTCRSTDYTNVEFSGEVSARAGENSILRIELAGAIRNAEEARERQRREEAAQEEARERQRREEAARIEKQRREEAARIEKQRREENWAARCQRGETVSEAGLPLMVEVGGGVLRQCATGLLWTQRDNGADIDWNDATRYCSAKGDWRLPTREELKSLYGGSETTPCGDFTCRVSSKFRLTNAWFWTSETYGSSEAWNAYLGNGAQYTYSLDYRTNERALCVRRP